MTRTCYIVVNALPVHFGWQVRPDGLRASQLAHQARQVFTDVRFILFLERFNHLQSDRNGAILAVAREDTIIIASSEFDTFCGRIEPAVFVFLNTDYTEEAGYAEQRHRVVYDASAPRALEVAHDGGDASAVTTTRRAHQRMIAIADRTFVSTVDPREREDRGGKVRLNRQGVTGSAVRRNGGARSHLIAGETIPRRGDPSPLLAALGDHLRADPGAEAILIMPPPQPESRHALEYAALRLMARVTLLSNLSAVNDAEILSLGYGYVEWAPMNPVRARSASWRVLQAIAAGLPVLHQADTALDGYFDPFPGVRLTGPITGDDIAAFAASAKDGAFDAAVASARTLMEGWSRDETLFAGLA